MSAYLVLSDGSVYEGQALGARGECGGEVVFNTGMTGYQEVLSDPSYAGQIVLMTYPLIGNYGINPDDFESDQLQPSGFIVKEACAAPSNWRSTQTLHSLLEQKGLVGLQGIDTRAITKHIRSAGVTMGMITQDPISAKKKLEELPSYEETDFVSKVSTKAPYVWGYEGKEPLSSLLHSSSVGNYKHLLAVIDCGLKQNILRRFAALGVRSVVLPHSVTAEEILDWAPDGVLVSPGPGDPNQLGKVVATVKELLGTKPLFGICLGNQILCHAVGGRTFKLKFGHRGSNHPVKDLLDGSVTITSQNHGYAVDPDSLDSSGAKVTQINLNDGTVEGIALTGLRASSIQYHPEAAPGPWDSRKYFVRFVEEMGDSR